MPYESVRQEFFFEMFEREFSTAVHCFLGKSAEADFFQRFKKQGPVVPGVHILPFCQDSDHAVLVVIFGFSDRLYPLTRKADVIWVASVGEKPCQFLPLGSGFPGYGQDLSPWYWLLFAIGWAPATATTWEGKHTEIVVWLISFGQSLVTSVHCHTTLFLHFFVRKKSQRERFGDLTEQSWALNCNNVKRYLFACAALSIMPLAWQTVGRV